MSVRACMRASSLRLFCVRTLHFVRHYIGQSPHLTIQSKEHHTVAIIGSTIICNQVSVLPGGCKYQATLLSSLLIPVTVTLCCKGGCLRSPLPRQRLLQRSPFRRISASGTSRSNYHPRAGERRVHVTRDPTLTSRNSSVELGSKYSSGWHE